MRYSKIAKQYFTVQEAEQKISSVNKLLLRLIKLNQVITLVKTLQVQTEVQFTTEVFFIQQYKKLHKLYFKFFKTYEDMLKLGAVIKDIDQGLVDFYAMHEGREILLCYKLGEKSIACWHEVKEGFNARKSVEELKLQNI